jgi:hypothetical protein
MPLPPLATLNNINQDNNAYLLNYPPDISDPKGKRHYVQFQIFEAITNKGAINSTPAAGDNPEALNKDVIRAASTEAKDNPLNNTSTLGPGFTGGINPFAANKVTVTTRTTDTPVGSIALYIPDEVVQQQEAQYGELSLIGAANALSGGVVGAVSSYVQVDQEKGQGLGMILNYIGYTFNPQEQLMFEGIRFRTFSMSFTFTPTSQEEALTIQSIIRTFRQHAAPRVISAVAGFFFVPPSQFYVQYFLAGQGENKYINKFKRSVLENVSVNYAPNGWSAHADGAPVQTTLTLSFKELELVDKLDIRDEGY